MQPPPCFPSIHPSIHPSCYSSQSSGHCYITSPLSGSGWWDWRLTLLQVPLVVPRLLFLRDKLLHPACTEHRCWSTSSSSSVWSANSRTEVTTNNSSLPKCVINPLRPMTWRHNQQQQRCTCFWERLQIWRKHTCRPAEIKQSVHSSWHREPQCFCCLSVMCSRAPQTLLCSPARRSAAERCCCCVQVRSEMVLMWAF